MVSDKALFLLSMLTIAINFLIFGGLIYLGWSLKHNSVVWIGQKIPFLQSHSFVSSIFEWVLFVFWILICVFIAVAIASIVSGPLLDLISEKTEKLLLGSVSPLPFSIVDTCKESIVILRLAARALVVGCLAAILLGWIPIAGQIVPLLITAHYVTLNFMQPVLARNKISYKDRLAFSRTKTGALLGFGLPTQLIPFLLLPLLTPALVIGATRLYISTKS